MKHTMINPAVLAATCLPLLIAVALLAVIEPLNAQFAGGDGSVDNPFQVATPTHLNNIRFFLGEDHTLKYYTQTADIDLDEAPYNTGYGWQPIGTSEVNSFRGHYNGNGYAIINLYINRSGPSGNNLGLFGITYNASLINVQLLDASVSGNRTVGILAGRTERSSTEHCISSGEVTGDANGVGGLIGINSRSTISNSYSTASVQGIDQVGGLTGQSFANAFISYCFSTGAVNGRNSIGGLVGENYTGNIYSSYSKSRVQGTRNVGGLAGRSVNRSFITNCYSIGQVTGNFGVGGLTGSVNEDETVNSYWNIQTSGTHNSASGSGRLTTQMTSPYSPDTYLGWDFREVWMDDRLHQINNGYPFFRYYCQYISFYPTTAISPNPRNQQTNISVSIDSLRWIFVPDPVYPNPTGFKVYFNDSDNFNQLIDYQWFTYEQGIFDYAVSMEDYTPLDYESFYYWKVIPTTDNNDNQGGDAENVPVWSFLTEGLKPYPYLPECISPVDGENDVPLTIDKLIWSYVHKDGYSLPSSFRVYINNTGHFQEDDDYKRIQYDEEQIVFHSPIIIDIKEDTKYYWKVVPTTETSTRNIAGSKSDSRTVLIDAKDVPVWSFTTEKITDVTPLQPRLTQFIGNYPNPFNPKTAFSFSLGEGSVVEISIYCTKGKLVIPLIEQYYPQGKHEVIWGGKSYRGSTLPSGVYLFRFRAGTYEYYGRTLMLK